MNARLKTVMIIDDEPGARMHLREIVESFSELSVAAEIGDGASAIKAIEELQPDIVFLDIDMPELDGFGVARATEHLNYQLVFVTAHFQFALQAFQTHAIDYILKPVRPASMEKCIGKMLRQQALSLKGTQAEQPAGKTVALDEGALSRIVSHDHILFIEGLGRYRRVHLSHEGKASHRVATLISDTTLDEFEGELSGGPFLRVHRSYIVNSLAVTAFKAENRRHYLVLDGADQDIPIARMRVRATRKAIGLL